MGSGNGQIPIRDVRKAYAGQTVYAVFFRRTEAGTWEQYGPTVEIPRQLPRVDSLPANRDGETFAGAIYWDAEKVFESKPMLCLKGDSFTFFFDEPSERR